MNLPHQNQVNQDNLPEPDEKTQSTKSITRQHHISPQLIISILFILAYFLMLGAILYIESSDTINMEKGENSMIDELQILFGAITAGVGQVLNYWFSNGARR